MEVDHPEASLKSILPLAFAYHSLFFFLYFQVALVNFVCQPDTV